MHNDGNLGTWLEAVDSEVKSLTAGFTVDEGARKVFEASLRGDRDAKRLVRDVLPKVPGQLLTGFLMVVVNPATETRLVAMRRRRGESFKKVIRAGARKDKAVRGDAARVLGRADRAFDVRREGLAEYCFGAVVLKRYLEFRTGQEPSARELAALLRAGLAASGKPGYVIDHDLLRRNMNNYEKRHPLHATGARCAQIIEQS